MFDKNLIDIMYLTILHDDNLEKQILKNPNAYVRFPKDIHEFFDSTQWIRHDIFYPNDCVKNYSGPKVNFYQFDRIR